MCDSEMDIDVDSVGCFRRDAAQINPELNQPPLPYRPGDTHHSVGDALGETRVLGIATTERIRLWGSSKRLR